MVKNNIEVDVKVKCIETGKTQVQIAEEINTTSQYVNRVIKKKDGVVNNTFVQMMEALGYLRCFSYFVYFDNEKRVLYTPAVAGL